MTHAPTPDDEYITIRYLQFNKSRLFRTCETIAGVLTWPLVLPLALLSRLSDLAFRTVSESLSVIPYIFGIIVRYEFYRFALSGCGKNVHVEFGAIFIERRISIGSNILIGRYCILHHCDIGDYVLIGERCTFLSGSRQHACERTDVPMALQGGHKKRISLGSDSWIGSHAIVMESVGSGAIVAAGAVVTRRVEDNAIVAGNPAKVVRMRE